MLLPQSKNTAHAPYHGIESLQLGLSQPHWPSFNFQFAKNFSTSGPSHMLPLLPRTFFFSFHMPNSVSFKSKLPLFPQTDLLQPTCIPLLLSLLVYSSFLLWHFIANQTSILIFPVYLSYACFPPSNCKYHVQ